jgi:AraC-like DNA-binding protein
VTDEPAPVELDSRGILDPWLLRQRLALTRYGPGDELAGLIDHFWAIRWDLPYGEQHHQEVLTHPAGNISVSHPDARSGSRAIEARLTGVARRLADRVVAGRGWVVAAMTTPGGLGAFLTGSAARLTDRTVPLGSAVAVDEAALIAEVTTTADETDRVAILRGALGRAVVARRVDPARQVAQIARLAEADRGIRELGELSQKAGVSQRTLQRMFLDYAGVSPTWVLRRYRLLEAAEAVRNGERVSWTEVAATLGYADQAHLIRDFRAATGRTPAAYAQAQSGH